MKKVNVGLLGFGTVGAGVADILFNKRDDIKQKTGIDINLKYIADLDLSSDRGIDIPEDILIKDADIILKDKEIDIVVELIGGSGFAKDFILKAAKAGKHIVTANKALLAESWEEIVKAVTDNNVDIMFEASVAGGIPIIKAIKESFSGNKIKSIKGIINGTANYILTKMKEEKIDLKTALAEAQSLGYAEADPKFDIEGIDTAHKLSILLSLAFGVRAKLEDIYIEGITDISLDDILYAEKLGYVIKLLAIGKESDGNIEARVHPAFVRKEHPLGSVNGVYNAVYVEADAAGDNIFYGKGAGRYPTASAVVGDIVDLGMKIGTDYRDFYLNLNPNKKVADFDETVCRYYLKVTVEDKTGVLASLADILGDNNISIASVIQNEDNLEGKVPLVIMTHKAKEKDIQKSIQKIKKLECIKGNLAFIRVED